MVTGGVVLGGDSEAQADARGTGSEFGVGVRWAEDRSRDDARERAKLRGDSARGGDPHCRARGAQLRHAACAGGVRGGGHRDDSCRNRDSLYGSRHSLFDYLPSIGGLRTSYYAVYEILGNLVDGSASHPPVSIRHSARETGRGSELICLCRKKPRVRANQAGAAGPSAFPPAATARQGLALVAGVRVAAAELHDFDSATAADCS